MSALSGFDLIVVGTGPAASFFLLEALRHLPATARVAVLERGARNDHAWQVEHRRATPVAVDDTIQRTGDTSREWTFTIGFGGGSNCWWAGAHRFHPNDFRLKSLYGQGRDWPVSYDELEPFYVEAETIMQVSGEDLLQEIPRSAPFPQPPHAMLHPDLLLKQKYPRQYAVQPTARAREATATRPACCGARVCTTCPMDAKFTVLNGMAGIYGDPRVSLFLESEVVAVEMATGLATGVRVRRQGGEETVSGDLVVLGANAIFNPHILLASGIAHPLLGAGLSEQLTIGAQVELDGLDGFQGSTSFSGHGLMLYDGEHRRTAGACLLETYNTYRFRSVPGRWRERVTVKLSIEDLPRDDNRVMPPGEGGERPQVRFLDYSDYGHAGLARARDALPALLSPWPVEEIRFGELYHAGEHILGTTRMGRTAETGVIDAGHLLHGVRNIACLGGSAFATIGAMNPTLTICALSLMAARGMFASRA